MASRILVFDKLAYDPAANQYFQLLFIDNGGSFNLYIKDVLAPTNPGLASQLSSAGATPVIAPSGVGNVNGVGTTNILPKWTNGPGSIIGDSRLADDGSDITIDSDVGTTTIGDVLGAGNSTKILVDDTGKNIVLNLGTTQVNVGLGSIQLTIGAAVTALIQGTAFTLQAGDLAVSLGNIVLSAGTISFPDNVRQTFNPGANNPGLNVGSNAGDPSTPANGDVWYDSTGNLLRARVNGATITLNTSSGGTVTTVSVTTANGVSGSVATDTTTPAITITLGAITPSSVNSPGALQSGTVSVATGSLALANSGSAFLTTIQAGVALAARTYLWPTNFGGAGSLLTDAAGNGVLSWATAGLANPYSQNSGSSAAIYFEYAQNTPSTGRWGVENGTGGGTIFTGSASNAIVFGARSNSPVQFFQNNALVLELPIGGGVLVHNALQLGVVSSATGAINLANSASAFLTTIQAGNALAARTYIWPTDFGGAGSVLTDAAGNGTLSWGAAPGGGTVTAVSVATANGVSGSSSGGPTPALTITLGAITPSSVTASGALQSGTVSVATGALNLANSASAFLTTIQAGNAAAARTYVWPTNFGAAGATLTDAAGNGTLSWVVPAGGTLTSYIVANLPAPAQGALAFVTDAQATAITGLGLAVVGGGTNKVVVYSDGTSWFVL